MDVMLNADHIIDLGPQGGHRGGEIVTEGTPEQVAAHPTSLTAHHLREAFARRDITIAPSAEAATTKRTKPPAAKTKRAAKAKVGAR
jgi:excinuclease ABC subunit A